MRLLVRLRSCQKGATIVEFALLAPALFILMFGIIETGRLLWTQQTLDEIAFSTVRCMSVDSACGTTVAQQNHAVARAEGYGIALATNKVTPQANVTCKGFANSNAVTIDTAFSSPVAGLIPGLPLTLKARACFPKLS